jgi:ring-1,2-phenylacetyl-CoA epoxidase subunit PaaE
VLLINSNCTTGDVIFQKGLRYLEQSFKHRLKLWYVFSGTANDYAAYPDGFQGRLNKLVLKKKLKKELGDELTKAAFFLCGPNGLINMAAECLGSLAIPAGNIYKEYFAPLEKVSETITLPEQTMEVLFHHIEQTNLLEVKPRQTILEAALESRIPISYSCKNGTCGTCIAKVLEGKVHMVNNFALRQEHLSLGYVLLCQAYALDSTVTVETVCLS